MSLKIFIFNYYVKYFKLVEKRHSYIPIVFLRHAALQTVLLFAVFPEKILNDVSVSVFGLLG